MYIGYVINKPRLLTDDTLFQDHLIPNSAWKDYSANTNYAFDSIDSRGDDVVVKKHPQNGNGRAPPQGRPRSNPPRPQGRPPSVPPQPPPGDSRSLQRPRSAALPPHDRSTFSLPRTQYDRHTVGAAKGGQMPADFYFMPSQRKYSGEVVRVYVGYNDHQKRDQWDGASCVVSSRFFFGGPCTVFFCI